MNERSDSGPSREPAEAVSGTSYERVQPIRGATRLFALVLGLAFIAGSTHFLRAIWRHPERFEGIASPWLLTVGGVLFILVGLQFCAQAAFPVNFARLANARRRRRSEGVSPRP